MFCLSTNISSNHLSVLLLISTMESSLLCSPWGHTDNEKEVLVWVSICQKVFFGLGGLQSELYDLEYSNKVTVLLLPSPSAKNAHFTKRDSVI